MTSVSRGRPQASSRETLADAACELFLEKGYDATTVADITQRAGVSRSSFFNYFEGKAGAIWFTLDAHLASFAARTRTPGRLSTHDLDPLRDALAAAPPHTLALAIANADAMGLAPELTSGRALRQASLAADLMRGKPLASGSGSVHEEVYTAALSAAVFSSIWRWAVAGAGAHHLGAEIQRSLDAIASTDGAHLRGPLRVVVIGTGAIGARVATALYRDEIPGAQLSGIVTRRAGAVSALFGSGASEVGEFTDIHPALDECDLVVECAGISAAKQYGPSVIASGKTLLIVSIGVFADPVMRARLEGGPGDVRLTTGAIGGLDLLTAAARPQGIPAGITHARITSTKLAASLVQPWMSDKDAAALVRAAQPIELFTGSVASAVEQFPGSLNVACALAAATGLWDETEVRLVADPSAELTTHDIEAHGAAGRYRFSITNEVSPHTPTSSAVVAEAVLRGVATLARPGGTFV